MAPDINPPIARRVARLLWRITRPFLIAYVVVVLIAMYLETRLVYPAPGPQRGDWNALVPPHEDVWFTSADGTKLNGWLVLHPTSKRVILYSHGNGENVALDARLIAFLSDRLRASVFVYDYRGYGRSEGSPSEAGCIADGIAARKWLCERLDIKPTDIILIGHSLGGGVAVALASEGGAKALVIENTFSRMVDVAAFSHWWLPVRLVMRNRYDSLSRIQKYDGPLFQTHGAEDTLIPIHFGQELFATAPSKTKEFLEAPGLTHDDGPPDDYYPRLAAFLDAIGAE